MKPALGLRDVVESERRYAWLIGLAVVTGMLGAVGNVVFREAIAGATWLFQGRFTSLGRGGIPLALVTGGLALLALDRLFPGEALGYGFPRFLEMLHLHGASVKRRWMVVKTLGAAISLGAGAAVGREGPIAQIGGSIGAAVARLGRLATEERKVLIACGAGAGIATTFNAPLGGLLFAQEIVLLGEAHLANFSLIVVATTTAVVVARGLFGNEPVFHVMPFQLDSYWECLTYGVLGVVIGLLAVGYIRFFHAVAARLRRSPWPRSVVLLAGLALVGLLDVVVPENVSDGYPVVDQALAGRLEPGHMAMLAAAKVVGSSISLGCGAPGGVFGPIFFIGAMIGGAFRGVSAFFLPALTGPRGSYALVGLGAFLAATTHAPLTAIFLLFEMTGNYDIALPALITSILAVIVASSIEPESIDTLGLARAGRSLRPPREQIMDLIPVSAAFHQAVDPIPANASVAEILRVIGESRATSFPVLDAEQRLLGTISVHDVRGLLVDPASHDVVIAADLCDPNVPTVTLSTSLGKALGRMEADDVEEIPVVDDADPRRIVGLLSRADVIRAYNRALLTMRTVPTAAGSDELPQWSRAYGVTTLAVPPEWIGRSLRELDCRARFGVSVLAVQADDKPGRTFEVPEPDRVLREGESMVVAGPAAAVRRLERTVGRVLHDLGSSRA